MLKITYKQAKKINRLFAGNVATTTKAGVCFLTMERGVGVFR